MLVIETCDYLWFDNKGAFADFYHATCRNQESLSAISAKLIKCLELLTITSISAALLHNGMTVSAATGRFSPRRQRVAHTVTYRLRVAHCRLTFSPVYRYEL